ncbi:GNAT family N-acetyltransferase [Virgibacillus oceani]
MEINFHDNKNIPVEQLERLYTDVQWYFYTQDLEVLQQTAEESLDVISAWKSEELVGLIRLTIIYIQGLLVLNAYQNQGIATQLMQQVLKKYKYVFQNVLLTEEAADVRHFYRSVTGWPTKTPRPGTTGQ